MIGWCWYYWMFMLFGPIMPTPVHTQRNKHASPPFVPAPATCILHMYVWFILHTHTYNIIWYNIINNTIHTHIYILTDAQGIKGPSGYTRISWRGSSQASSVFNTNAGEVPDFIAPKLPERMTSQIAATAAQMTTSRGDRQAPRALGFSQVAWGNCNIVHVTVHTYIQIVMICIYIYLCIYLFVYSFIHLFIYL